jgi:hypothetical protein
MRYADGSVSSRNKIFAVSGADKNDTMFWAKEQYPKAFNQNIFSTPNLKSF